MCANLFADGVQGAIRGIGLWGNRQVDSGLCQGKIAFRNPEEMDRLLGRDSLLQRAGIAPTARAEELSVAEEAVPA